MSTIRQILISNSNTQESRGFSTDASNVTFNDEDTQLNADNIQDAIEKLSVKIDNKDTSAGKLDKINPSGSGSLSINRKINTANGTNSTTIGSGNTASGDSSVAEGNNTIASGINSHSSGSDTTASGLNSFSAGNKTKATNTNSYAGGYQTTASGENSFASGNQTTAAAQNSFAIGKDSTADKTNSVVIGEGLKTTVNNEIVVGKYNNENANYGTSNPSFVVGTGTSSAHKDGFVVLDDGTSISSKDVKITNATGTISLKDLSTDFYSKTYKEIKEVTKSQYEALGTSVNSDNIVYYIKDATEGLGNVKLNGISYTGDKTSTEPITLPATSITYDDTVTQLNASNVQLAIREIVNRAPIKIGYNENKTVYGYYNDDNELVPFYQGADTGDKITIAQSENTAGTSKDTYITINGTDTYEINTPIISNPLEYKGKLGKTIVYDEDDPTVIVKQGYYLPDTYNTNTTNWTYLITESHEYSYYDTNPDSKIIIRNDEGQITEEIDATPKTIYLSIGDLAISDGTTWDKVHSNASTLSINQSSALENAHELAKVVYNDVELKINDNVYTDSNLSEIKFGKNSDNKYGYYGADNEFIAFGTGGGGGTYTLPAATSTTLGGIKVGENLTINESGVLSAEGGGSTVTISADYTEGTKIATINIDENSTNLFIPTGSSGASTWEELEDKPFNSLSESDFEVDENNVLSIKNQGSDVSYTSEITEGTKIGTLTIDSVENSIIVPEQEDEIYEVTKAQYDSYSADYKKNKTFCIKDWSPYTISGGNYNGPIGEIVAYMGKTAPNNFLICDGSIYNIADYLGLANHINQQFGSFDYFGGDGTTTFAVPDLRGEFLRGTGGNSRQYQGGGESVGKHQDSTEIPSLGHWEGHTYQNNSDIKNAENVPYDQRRFTGKRREWSSIEADAQDTSPSQFGLTCGIRPTNTSVLYCIRYREAGIVGDSSYTFYNSGNINITKYTSENNKFVAPSNGYVRFVSNSNSNVLLCMGVNNGAAMCSSKDGVFNALFVLKGMELYFREDAGSLYIATFYPVI